MHPPWTPGGGSVYADYLLKLPEIQPLKLTFANAIRDHTEKEPPSDGVLFRAWASRSVAGDGAEQLYQRFTDSKVWVEGEADLSGFAGETILLRLECHPGPSKDTTCDSAFWAEPTVVSGDGPPRREFTFAEGAADTVAVGRRLLAGTLPADKRYSFIMGEGDERVAAVFRPSARGIVDSSWSLVSPGKAVGFDGFTVDILGQHAVQWPTALTVADYKAASQNGATRHIHVLERDGKQFELTLTLRVEGDGLRIGFECPERITDFSVGTADQEAPVVYYGHGYRMVNPAPFRAWFGGHDLATSHVGSEFSGGLSLLQAVDVPPDFFEVDRGEKLCRLHTHMNGTLTLVAGDKGAMDCAIRYRPLYDKQPAGGVEKLAGRFCFDIWGGRYGDIADRMAEAVRYGLTDAS